MPNINLYNIDCMEFMKGVPDKYYDLAIVDPPYGIGISQMNMGSRKTVKPDSKKWDSDVPDESYFTELKRVSKNQIIWGGNYFESLGMFNRKAKRLDDFRALNGIVWDKGGTMYGRDFSEAEIAYSTVGNGWFKLSPNQLNRFHPTQKPVALYQWLLKKYAKTGDKILDTHGGSMSIAIACHEMGFDLDATELDKDYFEAALKRYKAHISQQKLFTG